ncbi:MAG: membrane protein insertion efficiency factor YidD [Rhodospirillaceae bacterium]|nr:membrane protein insertion efficiency factor YidD [Rhodospirillaceae bacterium]
MISRGIGFILRALITVYQWTFSALIGRTCRFEPSCSNYTAEAILVHGPAKGTWLGLKRIARCHPWGDSGYDPVSEVKPCTDTSCSSHARTHSHV